MDSCEKHLPESVRKEAVRAAAKCYLPPAKPRNEGLVGMLFPGTPVESRYDTPDQCVNDKAATVLERDRSVAGNGFHGCNYIGPGAYHQNIAAPARQLGEQLKQRGQKRPGGY